MTLLLNKETLLRLPALEAEHVLAGHLSLAPRTVEPSIWDACHHSPDVVRD